MVLSEFFRAKSIGIQRDFIFLNIFTTANSTPIFKRLMATIRQLIKNYKGKKYDRDRKINISTRFKYICGST